MNNQVEQIRAEIERRLSVMPKSAWGTDELKRLLSFIDSLQEEPKPKFKVGQTITDPTDPTFTVHINKIEDGKYIERDDVWVLIPHADEEYQLVEGSELTHSLTKKSDQEEPVSEDLEKELEQYFVNNHMQVGEDNRVMWSGSFCPNLITDFRNIARHFAEWGKYQITKTAVGAVVKYDNFGHLIVRVDDIGVKSGDEIKIRIFKKE